MGRAPIGVRWVDVQKTSGESSGRDQCVWLHEDPSLFADKGVLAVQVGLQ